MGDCTGEGGRHPPQGFFDHGADVGEIRLVVQGRESI